MSNIWTSLDPFGFSDWSQNIQGNANYTPPATPVGVNYNINPSLTLPTSGGMSGNSIDNLLSSVTFGLFGSDPSYQPYQKDGLWYWSPSETKNPVPITNIPGAKQSPSKVYRKTADQVRAFSDLYPYYMQAILNQQPNAAQIQTDIAKQQSPQLAELMYNLYSQWGPLLNQVGNRLDLQNATAQDAINRQIDPEYYSTRAGTSKSLADLMGSIDLSGKLSGGEREEISRGLSQENMRRGVNDAPSQLDTVGNAMTFGQAGRARQLENQNQLTKAISAATQFLPTAKTRQASNFNQGDSKFTGIQDSGGGQNTLGLGSGMLNNLNQLTSLGMQQDFAKSQGGFGNLFSGALAGGLGSGLGKGLASFII